MLKMVWPEEKHALLNMNAILTDTNWIFFFNKKLVQYKVSFYKDISFPNHSEKNSNNLPILFSTTCLTDTSLKTGSWQNRMTFTECNIVVTVLRLIVTNSLSIKWLHPNYIEHWSNNKNREQQLEIYLIQCSEIKGLIILSIIFWRYSPFRIEIWQQLHSGIFPSYCMKRMLKAITIQHTAT